jgi:hypothetical protein
MKVLDFVRRFGIHIVIVAVVAFAIVQWRRRHTPPPSAPSGHDLRLPDSAPLILNGYQGFSVAPSGDFIVYQARHDSTTMLWYASLRDSTTRPIPGTEGAYGPRVSPDGKLVAYVDTHIEVIPIVGGTARTLGSADDAHVWWTSPSQLLVTDANYFRVRWLNISGGEREIPIKDGCVAASWWAEGRRLICRGLKGGIVAIDPATGISIPFTMESTSRGDSTGIDALRLTVIANRYLAFTSAFTSANGELIAASFDPATLRVGRPMTVISGIRKGEGADNYDVTENGTLVYVPGESVQVSRLVTTHGTGKPTALSLDAAAFRRWALSADGKHLAAVVGVADNEELRTYDLSTGRHSTWLTSHAINQPRLTPTGYRIVVALSDASHHDAIVIGSPTTATPPDTIWHGTGAFSADVAISDKEFLGSFDLAMVRLTLNGKQARIDTVSLNASSPARSPDGRWLTITSYRPAATTLLSWPALDRRFPIMDMRVKAQWLSSDELAWALPDPAGGATFYRMRVSADSTQPLGKPSRWFTDPDFSDTPGWSFSVMPDGGVMYLHGAARNSATSLRVVPNWVAAMRAAVDHQ